MTYPIGTLPEPMQQQVYHRFRIRDQPVDLAVRGVGVGSAQAGDLGPLTECIEFVTGEPDDDELFGGSLRHLSPPWKSGDVIPTVLRFWQRECSGQEAK
jgi:hypothetical protein